jgi:chromosome segregation ATPase
MSSDGFYQGFMGQSVANANREVERANTKIAELRDLRKRDASEIEELNARLKKAHDSIGAWDRQGNAWNVHYQALEGERDYLLALLDKAYGEDKNPARKPAYPEDVPDRIYAGKRKGQRVTMREHIYFARLAELVKSKCPQLGCWKKLLCTSNIYE